MNTTTFINPIDRNYLLLQFKDKIFTKNATEFQSFFESIMEKAFTDFQKIRPYGNEGDGGNDGYRKNAGIYYQVYSPKEPSEKEAEAARKLKRDYEKLKNEWAPISEIKEYYFVFNDKYSGSIQKIEKAIAELEKNNPNITFDTFLAKELEETFFSLSEADKLSLGFDIDSTKTVAIAYEYLEKVEVEIDREIANSALKLLETIKDIISGIDNEDLLLKYEIIECRCLQKLEKVDEAKSRYENISRRYPTDPRPLLYLAEIYLNDKNFDKNKELLEKAKELNPDCEFLKLEELVRKNHLGEKIDLINIDTEMFSTKKVKANFYRLYALAFEVSGDEVKADSYIEKAIHLNPDRLSNYIVQLSLIEYRLLKEQHSSQILQNFQEFLENIKRVENKFAEYGDVGARKKAILNFKKLKAIYIQENESEFKKVSQETFNLSLACRFDGQIEQILAWLLKIVLLPDNDLDKLLEYLKKNKNRNFGRFNKNTCISI